jgi:hypothetical protein
MFKTSRVIATAITPSVKATIRPRSIRTIRPEEIAPAGWIGRRRAVGFEA